MQIIFVLFAFLILAKFVSKSGGLTFINPAGTGTGTGTELTELEKTNAIKVYNILSGKKLFDFADEYGLEKALVLASCFVESGSYIIKGYENADIIGDDGRSVGYMQVSQPALTDTNSYFSGRDYSFDEIKADEDNNFVAGCRYLYMCKKSAQQSGDGYNVWLIYKKYNGGRDETLTSKNSMARKYADKAFKFYKFYKNNLS